MTTPKAETTPKTRKSRNKDSEEQSKVAESVEKHEETPADQSGSVKSRGRTTTYNAEDAKFICEQLSEGVPLAHICRDENMPAVRTVSDWKVAHPEFAAAFARAREEGFDHIAAECLEIADETENDTVFTEHGDRPNAEWISRSRLRVETRLKLLAKWDPRRYGDKMTLAGDPEQPLRTEATLNVSGLSTEALAEIMKASDAAKSS